MRPNPSGHTEGKGLIRTHTLSYSTSWQAGDQQELEKSESYKCPGCSLHAAQASAAVRLLGKGKQANNFTGTSPAPGCEGSRISDLSTLPSSPEGNYLQETSQASRSTRHPKPLQLLP